MSQIFPCAQHNPLTQQNVSSSQAGITDYFNQGQQHQVSAEISRQYQRMLLASYYPRDMTASDLGIVDQLLDDKVGMEL